MSLLAKEDQNALSTLLRYLLRSSHKSWENSDVIDIYLKLEKYNPNELPKYQLSEIIKSKMSSEKFNKEKIRGLSESLKEIIDCFDRSINASVLKESYLDIKLIKKDSKKNLSMRGTERRSSNSPIYYEN